MISKELVQCVEDMQQAAQTGKISLDAQVRAYDLLETIMDLPEGNIVGPADIYSDTVATWCSSLGPAQEYCSEYARLSSAVDSAYDEAFLIQSANDRMKPLEDSFKAASAKAAEMSVLHQCAKETFDIWQNGGYFARQSASRGCMQE